MKGNHPYSELIRKIQKVLLHVGQKKLEKAVLCKCPASGLIAQQGPKERLHNNMLFRILNEKKQRGSWPIQIQQLVSRFMLSGYPSKGNFTWNPHGL